ncbi:MAG: Crp/Fnr family transcriptional regulator [Eggerthellaceae bacterium]|nr:Crp/Fnr family transcriptional regulator [Eggerthellaceae bacterium]
MQEIEEVLTSFLPFWEQLDQRQRNTLIGGTRRAQFERGAHIHNGEADCIGVLLVTSGELRAYMLSTSGRECTLFRVGAGESCVLAATCVLQMITFDLFLDAETDTQLYAIDSDVYAKVIEGNAFAEVFTYRQTADRFSDVMWVMHQQLFMGLDGRLSVFLLDEIARSKSDVLTLTHDEIARHIGSAREAVSRMLKDFAQRGIVVLSRGQVEVIDKAALRSMADVG